MDNAPYGTTYDAVAHVIQLDIAIKSKRYEDPPTEALADVNFGANPGDFVALVGPSGAGKSTLLNTIAGLDKDLDGYIHIDGKPIQANGEIGAPQSAFVFQTPRLMPWLTALDNVRLVLGKTPQDEAHAKQTLEEVQLGEFLHAYPGQLSGGMQRRVALARAFAVKPGLLLMDEPFVSLDEPTAIRLRTQLLALWSKLKPTVLYVTHDLREAIALADRLLFFSSRPGRIVLDRPVTIERPRTQEDVDNFYRELLAMHPDLLSGLVKAAVLEKDAHSTPGTSTHERASQPKQGAG